jgi:hypothetical protein
MTGRRAGYCAGADVPGYANDAVPPMGMRRGGGFGRGFGRGRGGGRGRGFGRGFGRGYYDGPAPLPAREVPVLRTEDEVSYLEGYAKQLEEDLKAIKDRLGELKKPKK